MRSFRQPALALLLALLAGLAALALGRPRGRPTSVHGRVLGPHGPLAGACVRYQGTPQATRTDAAGRFRLPARPGAARVTAWKEGYLIGGARRTSAPLTLRLAPLPAADNPGYDWVSPDPDPAGEHNCANCHAEVYREWAGSAHARSAVGRHFRDLYEGTGADGRRAGWGLLPEHPDGAGVCTSCHAPAVREGPALLDLRRVRGVAARGVHCDYCHKVAGLAGEPGLSHGRFGQRLLRPRSGQLFFGPLDDVDRGEDAFSPLYRDSRYCASCHEGVVFGVHVYSTYSEWLASPARRAGQHCQSCHMTPTGRLSNLAPGHGGLPRDPHTLANHRFFAGSLADHLRRCVGVSVHFRRPGTAVRVRVGVEGVGHRVPTGFIDRHLILTVEGIGPTGRPVPLRWGPLLPAAAGAELAGRPGRLYARLLRDEAGRGPVPFWRDLPDVTDTRLTPGQDDEVHFTFARAVARLRVRVLYRRFWQEVARAKGWPDHDLVVLERWAEADNR
jgi:hypothetical protein